MAATQRSARTRNKRAARTKKIFSIIIASNKPSNFVGLLDNLESTCQSADSFELLIKIDEEDEEMVKTVTEEVAKRPFEIRPLISPREGGYFTLHHSYERLFREISDPQTYFVSVFTDEIRFRTKGWDKKLKKYIGVFPDDVFRLRVSENKLRNYYSIQECICSPENYSITTRKWYELTGGMGDVFWGVDSWHQCIEYYLGQVQTKKNFQGIFRGVPVYDIAVEGMEAGVGWQGAALEERVVKIEEGWRACNSQDAHQKMLRCATRLAVHVWAHEKGLPGYDARDNQDLKIWFIYDTPGSVRPLASCQYYLPTAAYLHEKLPRLLNIQRMDPFGLANGIRAWPPLKDMEQLEEFFARVDNSDGQREGAVAPLTQKVTVMLTAANIVNAIRRFCALSVNLRRPSDDKDWRPPPAFAEFNQENMELIEDTLFEGLEGLAVDDQERLFLTRHVASIRCYMKERKEPSKRYKIDAAILWLKSLVPREHRIGAAISWLQTLIPGEHR